MTTARTRQPDFTAGELSPRLYGRVDLDRYARGVKILENMILLEGGGATRRPGTRYVATAAGECVLRKFEFSTTDAYVLEFSSFALRVYKNGARVESGGAPVQITTPYTTAQLRGLRFTQSADVLYIVHPSHPPRRLERYSDTVWKFRTVDFVPPPAYEYGLRPTTTLTPSAITGTGITLTAGANVFTASDVGREVVVTGGTQIGARCTITAYTSATQVTATVVIDFVSVAATTSGNWRITVSPQATATPSAAGRVGAVITVTLSAAGYRRSPDAESDTGRYVVINDGVVEVTSVNSQTQITGTVRAELASATASPAGSWTLEDEAWSDLHGYPRDAAFSAEDRLVFVATTRQPTTFWLSASGDYEKFAAGADDDDAIAATLNTDQQNTIVWAVGAKKLLLGTVGGEFIVDPGDGKVLTPTNVPVKSETTHGSSLTVRPVRVGNAILFPSRSNRKLRQLTYSFDADSYVAPDLLLLAEHLTEPKIISGSTVARTFVDLAYQREPHSLVWAPRADGTLLGLTYLPEQNVLGWHRHITGTTTTDPDGRTIVSGGDGEIVSVAVIPHPDGGKEQTWLAVKRIVGGATVYYVEIVDDTGLTYSQLNTDAAATYTGVATTTMTGLTHLNGKTVAIVGDGAVYPNATVSAGQVTLDGPAATKIEAGLPYTARLVTLRPELAAVGSSQGLKQRNAEVVIRFHETGGVTFNGDQIPFRTSADALGAPPALFSGDKTVSHLGDGTTEDDVTITQTQPLPCTVLAVFARRAIGE